MDIKNQLKQYLLTLTNQQEISGSINLFESNLLSSLDVLDLILFVEEKFQISLSTDDIDMDQFGTIDSMTNLIQKLQKPDVIDS